MNFATFRNAVNVQLTAMQGLNSGLLLAVVQKDEIWDTYINS